MAKSPGWEVNEGMVARLWRFITERQEVRYRRHVLHAKPPWTEDPVLRDHHFTNIYREDDPGTVYCVENIIRSDMPFSVCVWNVMWYRMWGKEATWDTFAEAGVKLEPSTMSIARMGHVMRQMVEEGRSPFHGAYLISNYGRKEDKVTVMLDVMNRAEAGWHTMIDELCRTSARGVDGRQEAHKVLSTVYGVGPFIAFQTLVDLTYPVLGDKGLASDRRMQFDNDGWATCGPGAERGIGHVLAGIKPSEWNGGLRYLTRRSETELDLRAFWWRTRGGERQPLDRANMCNCLCEFDKYVRLSAGEGKGRRRPFDAVSSYKADREARGHGYQYDIERDAGA